MNENWRKLKQAVPCAPHWRIEWGSLKETPLQPYISKMKNTRQNPRWHEEGDVWTHTKMVCEELASDEGFRNLSEEKQQIVFAAALLHDIGKIPCTRLENGTWTSPGHTLTGSKMARELLWKDFGLCGTGEQQNMRECICALIRNHSVPVHILDQEEPERRLIRIAAFGEGIPDFSLSLLQILVRADLKGRLCKDTDNSLETADLCFSLAKELGILTCPYGFASVAARYAYLSGKNVWRDQELYDDTWGEITLMSGLPGTGKDTWIKKYRPDHPVISLDEIRKELGISPAEPQGKVINEARQRAKVFLRKHQPFVWNATDTTAMIRQKQVNLFEQYHASVRIVFLETGWETEAKRNRSREREVPTAVIEKLLRNLEPPEPWEARNVEWFCV